MRGIAVVLFSTKSFRGVPGDIDVAEATGESVAKLVQSLLVNRGATSLGELKSETETVSWRFAVRSFGIRIAIHVSWVSLEDLPRGTYRAVHIRGPIYFLRRGRARKSIETVARIAKDLAQDLGRSDDIVDLRAVTDDEFNRCDKGDIPIFKRLTNRNVPFIALRWGDRHGVWGSRQLTRTGS